MKSFGRPSVILKHVLARYYVFMGKDTERKAMVDYIDIAPKKIQQAFHISCMLSCWILLCLKERDKASDCVLIFMALNNSQSSIIIHFLPWLYSVVFNLASMVHGAK